MKILINSDAQTPGNKWPLLKNSCLFSWETMEFLLWIFDHWGGQESRLGLRNAMCQKWNLDGLIWPSYQETFICCHCPVCYSCYRMDRWISHRDDKWEFNKMLRTSNQLTLFKVQWRLSKHQMGISSSEGDSSFLPSYVILNLLGEAVGIHMTTQPIYKNLYDYKQSAIPGVQTLCTHSW